MPRVILHNPSHELDPTEKRHVEPSPPAEQPSRAPCQPCHRRGFEPAISPHAPATQLLGYTSRPGGGVGVLSLAKARKDYYLQKVGEISPREDYYLRGGTASGSWHG